MSKNQHKPNANELWLYFQSVVNWIKATFPKYRAEMKGVAFGVLYNEFKQKEYDSKKLEEEITKLMLDDDVTKKSGIYSYVLTRQEKSLSITQIDKTIEIKTQAKAEEPVESFTTKDEVASAIDKSTCEVCQ